MNGIDRDDFNKWKHHPVSKMFFRYLHDKRRYLTGAMTEQWLAGTLTMQAEQTVRGQIIELMELEILPFEAVDAFYTEDFSNEEPNGSQASEV